MNHDAIYPGTFDPITAGHQDLIRRASRLYRRIIVAIAASPKKAPLFNLDERVDLATRVLAGIENVEIVGYEGLTLDFARARNVPVMVRGLRAVSDFEYEFQLATMSRQIEPDIETVFLTPDEQFAYISSSLVKEVALYGGDISKFVHPLVDEALDKRYRG